VRVGLPAIDDVIALPQTSVVTSLYGDYVYVVEPQAEDTAQGGNVTSAGAEAKPPVPEQSEALIAKQVFVHTGRRQGDLIQIESGVSAGQTVVTSGQNKLANNSLVTINNAANPAAVASDGGDKP
jgi:membrane fusion protein, multidrug efflux system